MYHKTKTKPIFPMAAAILAVILAVTIISTPLSVYASKQTSHQYIIAQDGTGNFATIGEGVEAAQSGDTLIVYPGTYDEVLYIAGKEINIIGVNKDLCILRSDSVSYRQSPLSIGAGTVANMTIYGMYTGSNQARELTTEEIASYNETITGDSWERQQNYKGYALHIDQNYTYGRSVTIDNCRIISENNHCIGIGARGNSTITIKNSELISAGDGSCLYMHDSPLENLGGQSRLIITDSLLTSYICPYIMTFQSLVPEANTTYLTFQNVKANAVAYTNNASYVSNNVNTFFDVETLASLYKAGLLESAGLTTTASSLVNYLSREETLAYMTILNNAVATGDTSKLLAVRLDEGITYIEDEYSTIPQTSISSVKHQVVAVYNNDDLPGSGWCGLNSVYLTDDSYGNTLVEMNAIQQ
jgi:hypothetical protein